VILVFCKRAIGEDVPNACLPELPCQDLQVLNQLQPPRHIPGRLFLGCAGPEYEYGIPKFVERHFEIARRQETVRLEGWDQRHGILFGPYSDILA
jgi:hypothetical protein